VARPAVARPAVARPAAARPAAVLCAGPARRLEPADLLPGRRPAAACLLPTACPEAVFRVDPARAGLPSLSADPGGADDLSKIWGVATIRGKPYPAETGAPAGSRPRRPHGAGLCLARRPGAPQAPAARGAALRVRDVRRREISVLVSAVGARRMCSTLRL
jgi:hypothetical protein